MCVLFSHNSFVWISVINMALLCVTLSVIKFITEKSLRYTLLEINRLFNNNIPVFEIKNF